jgi:hypothetical protein
VGLRELGWALNAVDEELRRIAVRGLCVAYKGQNARGQRAPIRFEHLGRLADHYAGGATPMEQQNLLAMLMAHQGMLRVNEYAGGRLQEADVVFQTPAESGAGGGGGCVGVVLRIRDSKTGKLDAAPQLVYIAKRPDRFDVVGPLWEHFRGHGLVAGTSSAGDVCVKSRPVFTMLVAGQRTETPVSDRYFRGAVRDAMLRIGYGEARFGTHSLRSGGANDALDNGVPLDVVMKQGRWKSSAWMVYRRSTPQMMAFMARMQPVPLYEDMAGPSPGELPERADGPAERTLQLIKSWSTPPRVAAPAVIVAAAPVVARAAPRGVAVAVSGAAPAQAAVVGTKRPRGAPIARGIPAVIRARKKRALEG